jgi:hypothetical protein
VALVSIDPAVAIGGGLASGVVVADAVLFVAGRTRNHLIEITLKQIAKTYRVVGTAPGAGNSLSMPPK